MQLPLKLLITLFLWHILCICLAALFQMVCHQWLFYIWIQRYCCTLPHLHASNIPWHSIVSYYYSCSLDRRSKTRIGHPILIHKKGSKVTSLHCNPARPEVLLSSGNDHYVSVFCICKDALFLFRIWYLHIYVIIRPVFGIQGSLKPTLPLPALLMDGLLIQGTFLHEVEIRSWQHVRTTEFVYGTIFSVICNPQVEKLCIVMISIVIWLPSKLSGIQRFQL